jgi:hypothetical protein
VPLHNDMLRSIPLIVLTLSLAQAANWSGRLVDADCKADDLKRQCAILPTTKAFGIQTPDGKYLKLDHAGNDDALVALRKFRNQKGDILRAGVVDATVTGTLDHDTIKAESLQLY